MSTTKVSAVMQNAGAIVQIVNTSDGAVATTTTLIPGDDTIPQNNEGAEFMTLAITPTNTNNKLLIEVVAMRTHSSASQDGLALFQDTTAGALATVMDYNGANVSTTTYLAHYVAAGTTSSTTFKVRLGGSGAGTTTFNGESAGSRLHGGVMESSITITEIQV